ncbi:unnamed protein product [marine sediment metagenome]|uniref:Uncharacterized protein n=1 Tax=marine sediment metagenome TaxID=412755 RepID=X1BYU3_9ZZZZ
MKECIMCGKEFVSFVVGKGNRGAKIKAKRPANTFCCSKVCSIRYRDIRYKLLNPLYSKIQILKKKLSKFEGKKK